MGRQRSGTIDETGGKYRVRMTLPSGERRPLGTYDTWEEAEGVRLAALEALEERPDGGVMCLVDFGETWAQRPREAPQGPPAA